MKLRSLKVRLLKLRSLKLLPLLLILCAVSAAAQAQFYKWVDENGKVHFSDQPPRKKPAEKLELKGIPKTGNQDAPSEAQRRERQQQLLKSMEKDRKAIEQRRAQERQDKKDKAALCQRLKKKKEKALWATHFYTVDKNGEHIYDDEKTAEAKRKAAVDAYDKNCL